MSKEHKLTYKLYCLYLYILINFSKVSWEALASSALPGSFPGLLTTFFFLIIAIIILLTLSACTRGL